MVTPAKSFLLSTSCARPASCSAVVMVYSVWGLLALYQVVSTLPSQVSTVPSAREAAGEKSAATASASAATMPTSLAGGG